ncbi:MAG: DUF559 domain-containing protein [Acidimicrobiales bacterium]
MANIDQRIITAAQPGDGLLSGAALDDLGLSRQGRRTRMADGRLVAVAPEVYLLGGLALTWSRRLRSAHLATAGIVSHMAAAAHHGFERIGSGAVEVTVPLGRSPRLHQGKVHRSRFLPTDDIDNSGPFPVTIPERTLLDITPRLGPRLLKIVLDDACRQGLIDKDLLRCRLDERRRQGLKGVRALDLLLSEPGFEPVLDSWLERRAKAVIDASDLPHGRWQVWSKPDGRATRVDLAYEVAMLIVEFDGHGTHATRAERQADAERMARLTAQGYCILRFTYDDVVERPEYVIITIASHLALRSVSAR